MSGGTCAHEGELVAMKAKIVEFWLKPVGDALRKRLENQGSASLVTSECSRLWRRDLAHQVHG